MKRYVWTLALMIAALNTMACSDDSSDEGGGSGGNASGGTATGGLSGSATGGSETGGSGGSGATGGSSSGGAGGSGGAGALTSKGICGQKSTATVTASEYSGTEEYYMVSDENRTEGIFDEYICHVRFDVRRIGAASPGCVDPEGEPCLWTHKVELSNAEVVTNVDHACEKNELGWNAAWMSGIAGTQPSRGYVDMYQSHTSVVLEDFGTPGAPRWDVLGVASWLSESGEFQFDNRFGDCRY